MYVLSVKFGVEPLEVRVTDDLIRCFASGQVPVDFPQLAEQMLQAACHWTGQEKIYTALGRYIARIQGPRTMTLQSIAEVQYRWATSESERKFPFLQDSLDQLRELGKHRLPEAPPREF